MLSFGGLFASRAEKVVRKCNKIVAQINQVEEVLQALTDDDLRGKTYQFRRMLQEGSNKDIILPEAFAVVREASKRLLNMRHYDVQLVGGMVLHMGAIAEMKTGEGKTLVATLPAYLNALDGHVHVVTVNDYLTERDYNWMGRIYNFLGVSVGNITGKATREERRFAYGRDIIYGVNSEIGFDYLRDNMQIKKDDLVLPIEHAFNYAIVDEVDSVLIDEARTPLIISGASQKSSSLYKQVNKAVLKLDKKFVDINEKQQSVHLTDDGIMEMEKILKGVGALSLGSSLYDMESCELLNHVVQGLKAHHTMNKDKDYIVRSGEIMLIDEFTGRISEGRRYSNGLHQALEAKEGVEVRNENQTMASITYQNFFRMYKKLAGMTGTAETEAKEFYGVYGLEVIPIPTNRPLIREDMQDGMFKTEDDKATFIARLVKERQEYGQPVLIGTSSIVKSEELSKYLTKEGIKHNVLNAKNHEREAHIIAEAGRKGAVTIATNMAGRGTDIRLGGSLDDLLLDAIATETDHEIVKQKTDQIKAGHAKERDEVVALGGLFVIGSTRNESRRIDNQLKGRSGRDGDPGRSQFFLSLEDDLLRIFGGDKVRTLLDVVGFKEAEPIFSSMLQNVIKKSQKKLENMHFEMRKNIVKYDDVINEQRAFVYEQRTSILLSENLDNHMKAIIENVVSGKISELPSSYANDAEGVNVASLKQTIAELCCNNITEADMAVLEELTFAAGAVEVEGLKHTLEEVIWNAYLAKCASYLEVRGDVERFILLQSFDECWKRNLQNLAHIREGVHLRSYGNKDPFVEYREESFASLQLMLKTFEEMALMHLFVVVLHPGNLPPPLAKQNLVH